MIEPGARTWAPFAALLCVLLVGASFASPARAASDSDPWEKMNRGIFRFNETLDRWTIEPVAKAWNFVMPQPVQRSLKNVYDTAWMPAVFGNHLLQAHPKQAFVDDLPRLVVNLTVGLGGLFDVASSLGIEDRYTDFGLTMGRWGVKPGPYLMLPLLGPSSIRDGAGRVADGFSSPFLYFMPFWGAVIVRGTELLNLRSLYLEEIAQTRVEAFDYYLFVRDAWIQNRRYRVQESRGEATADFPPDDDLYDYEDE